LQPFLSVLKSPLFEATGAAVCGFHSKVEELPHRRNRRAFSPRSEKQRRSTAERRNHLPQQGSRRSPAIAGSVGRGRATEWTSLPACGEARDASSARTTGQHRVCLVCGNAAARLPHTFRAEARTHFIYILEEKHEKERYQVQHSYGC